MLRNALITVGLMLPALAFANDGGGKMGFDDLLAQASRVEFYKRDESGISQLTGSGVTIASLKGPDGKYINYVLTNFHVATVGVRDAGENDDVSRRSAAQCLADDDKSKAAEKPEKKHRSVWEIHDLLSVYFYVYDKDDDHIDHFDVSLGEILAYDEQADLALLKLSTRVKHPAAKLAVAKKVLRRTQKVVVAGSPAGEVPQVHEGRLTDQDKIIDGRRHLGASPNIIQGSSGGALYDAESHELIGLTRVMSATFLGGYIPVDAIRDFLTNKAHIDIPDEGNGETKSD